MAIEQIILHVGNPKTGTTSLQQWLVHNEHVLAAHDIRYMRAFRRGDAHNFLATRALQGEHDAFLLKKMGQEIDAMSETRLLISAETASTVLATKAILRAFSAQMRAKTTIVYYFQRQDFQIEGLAKQRLKGQYYPDGDWSKSFERFYEWIGMVAHRGNYLTYFDQICATYPELNWVFRVYDPRCLVEKNTISDFWDFLGLAQTDRPPLLPREANKTPSTCLIAAMMLHKFETAVAKRYALRRLAQTHPQLYYSRDVLNDDQRKKMMAGFLEHNRRFGAVAGIDLEPLFHNEAELYSRSNFEADPQKWRLGFEQARAALAQVMADYAAIEKNQ